MTDRTREAAVAETTGRTLLLASGGLLCLGTLLLDPASPTDVRTAVGCSGSGAALCKSQGWSSAAWQVPPDGVPTDGAVVVSITADWSCGSPGGGGTGGGATAPATLEVRALDGTVVPAAAATPTTVAPPAPMFLQPTASFTQPVVWRAATPLAPSTTYELTVTFGSGAPSTKLAFTTGLSPYAPPVAVLSNPKLEGRTRQSIDTVCCGMPSGGCGGPPSTCTAKYTEHVARIQASADTVEPVAAAKHFQSVTLQVAIDGGTYEDLGDGDLPADAKDVCVRALGKNTLTGQTGASEPWCKAVAGIDVSAVPNCETWKSVLDTCTTMNPLKLPLIPPAAAAQYDVACGTSGAAGAGGEASAGTAGQGGAASVPPTVDASDEGCSVGATSAGSAGGAAVVIALAGGALRSRRHRRGRAAAG